jgi:hypothetical protein
MSTSDSPRVRAPSPMELLDQARVLLSQGMQVPAMMTARCALESHLDQAVGEVRGRRFNRRRAWRAKNLLTFLLAKGVVSRPEAVLIHQAYDRLSQAAHGNPAFVSQADSLLAAVHRIVERCGVKGGAV